MAQLLLLVEGGHVSISPLKPRTAENEKTEARKTMITNKLKTSRTNSVVPSELRLGLLVVAALVLTSAMPAFGTDGVAQCTAAPSGLVGWWPGDGNAKDITPKDHDGTLKDDGTDASSDTRFTTTTAGKVGRAFLFDGDRDYVKIPSSSTSDLNIPSGKVSVDAWINITQYAYYPSVLGKGDFGNNKESYALFVDPSGFAGFLVNRDGTSTGRALVIGKTKISTNTWTLVAGTYNGMSVHVYVNGSLDDDPLLTFPATSGATNKIYQTTNDNVLIGKAHRTPDVILTQGNGDTYFNGRIDEVELFNRALMASEIQTIYAHNIYGKCKCQKKPAEADGDVEDDDGHKSHVSMTAKRECDDNGQTDFKDDTGTEMKGENKAVAMSGNTAMVSGRGNLLDGTPVYYTAVLVGNQPLIGANLVSMTWTTATGSFFHRSGVMLDGYIVVPPQ